MPHNPTDEQNSNLVSIPGRNRQDNGPVARWKSVRLSDTIPGSSPRRSKPEVGSGWLVAADKSEMFIPVPDTGSLNAFTNPSKGEFIHFVLESVHEVEELRRICPEVCLSDEWLNMLMR
ncbi:hypothetical protein SprV_0301272500 [Sparganum proliferum]